jgi:hypothetical protein
LAFSARIEEIPDPRREAFAKGGQERERIGRENRRAPGRRRFADWGPYLEARRADGADQVGISLGGRGDRCTAASERRFGSEGLGGHRASSGWPRSGERLPMWKATSVVARAGLAK